MQDNEFLSKQIEELKQTTTSQTQSYTILSNKLTSLTKDVENITKDVNDCCSGAKDKERIIAHKTLSDTVNLLEKVVNKLESIERQNIMFASTTDDIKELKNNIAQLRMYGYMVIGGVVVIETAMSVYNTVIKITGNS